MREEESKAGLVITKLPVKSHQTAERKRAGKKKKAPPSAAERIRDTKASLTTTRSEPAAAWMRTQRDQNLGPRQGAFGEVR